jgi:two-component system CheB/CheR fusion protein
LIGVTNFFREPEAWKDLEKLVIDPLIDARPNDQPIRVWVPGCTTGEEPYSVAMLLIERLLAKGKHCDIQIFASDIDRDALAFARTGVYPENIAADVCSERLRQFFVKGEHTYRINKEVRDLVVFAEQNVISDPPFSKLDLISCRNLLIYLESEIQQKLLSMFHFALHEGGWLFLGNAETVNQQHDLFETVSRKWRIYRRIGPARAATLELPAPIRALPKLAPEETPHGGVRRMSHVSAVAQMAILQRYAPACVLVNRKMEVVYLHGSVDEYLQLPAGELASDVIAMSRPGLRAKLRSSIQQAIAERKPVTVENVRIKRGEKYHAIRLSVEPLRDVDKTDGLLLVAFDEASAANRVRIVYVEPRDVRRPDIPETTDEFEIVIRQLEEELRGTKEDLQTSIEELETSNEEFKAANEEVTSINEELQSTNEELETSKEELQSMNEELHTVNSQLEQKVMELESMTSDLTNLLASTDIATIFLDRQFRLRWFSPAATRLLRVIETDVGRPIRDFAHSFRDNSLLTDAGLVLQRLTPIEDEVQDEEQTWYLRRIAPYRTGDHRIDGVVITFTNISQRKSHETSLRELAEKLEQRVTERTEQLADAHAALKVTETRFRALLEATPDPLILLDADGTTLQINRETEKLFGYTRVEVVGQAIDVLIPERYRGQYETYRASYFRHPAPRSASIGMELAIRCKDGSELPVEVQLNPVEIDGQTLIITALRKVTSRKAAQPE